MTDPRELREALIADYMRRHRPMATRDAIIEHRLQYEAEREADANLAITRQWIGEHLEDAADTLNKWYGNDGDLLVVAEETAREEASVVLRALGLAPEREEA